MIEFALVLYLAFMLAAFGWRGWVQYRRTGDHGFRIFSVKLASLEGLAGVLFLVSLIAILVAPIATMADLLGCLALPRWFSIAGAVLALAGVVLALRAQLDMGASWRVGVDPTERTALVTSGFFTLVRNPIFSALGVFMVGFALMVPNVLSLAGLVLGAVGLELQVRCIEEPFLIRTHGDAYRDYAGRVGRFVPRVGRLSGKRAGG